MKKNAKNIIKNIIKNTIYMIFIIVISTILCIEVDHIMFGNFAITASSFVKYVLQAGVVSIIISIFLNSDMEECHA